MVGMLIQLLVLCLIFGIIYWVLTLLPLPEPFKMIALVIFALIVILVLLGMIGVIPGWRVGPWVQGWLPGISRWLA